MKASWGKNDRGELRIRLEAETQEDSDVLSTVDTLVALVDERDEDGRLGAVRFEVLSNEKKFSWG